MTGAYYNERDPSAAQWLRNLIAAGHIAPGEVDERSITEVKPDDLRGFRQCHWFAGIGVWSHALRRAGWPDDAPAWTGSCPCQPFSAAGKQQRFDDERHLWPAWFNLIRECRPAIVLGEQVASALDWLDLVSADLEGAGYAFGAVDTCAAGFGGAHIRQRLYFVAMATRERSAGLRANGGLADCDDARLEGRGRVSERPGERTARAGSVADGLAELRSGGRNPGDRGFGDPPATNEIAGTATDRSRDLRGLADPDGGHAGAERQQPGGQHGCEPPHDVAFELADAGREGRRQERADLGGGREGSRAQGLDERPGDGSDERRPHAPLLGRNPADWLFCRDGKWRPVEPDTFPLADAAPQRVGRLRAYGNALDAETAAQFVGAVREALEDGADDAGAHRPA